MKTALHTLAGAAGALLATLSLAAHVPGESLDSGLGALPHYSLWLDKTGADPLLSRAPAESLDDGLGELPPYALWRDKTGRDPMGLAGPAQAVTAAR